MLNSTNFKSNYYEPIHWKSIFNSAGMAVSNDSQPMGLVNGQGLLMLTDSVASLYRLSLCFENKDFKLTDEIVATTGFSQFRDQNIYLYQLDYQKCSDVISQDYIKFVNNIFIEIYHACQRIMVYTHDHLSARYYDSKPLHKLETVEYHFSDAVIILSRIHCLISEMQDYNAFYYVTSQFITTLTILSKLAGARAVLKNNAVELIFHVKLFQKFISE